MEIQTDTESRTEKIRKKFANNHPTRMLNPDSLSLVSEMTFAENLKLLNIGSKDGCFLLKLAPMLQDYELHGIDVDQRYVQKNIARNTFNNVTFHDASPLKMPFENDYFDIIVCTNTMQHLQQKVRALDEMYRVLKKGGDLYLLEGIHSTEWKNKFDKILRQSKFILPQKKFLPRTSLMNRSYFIHYVKK